MKGLVVNAYKRCMHSKIVGLLETCPKIVGLLETHMKGVCVHAMLDLKG